MAEIKSLFRHNWVLVHWFAKGNVPKYANAILEGEYISQCMQYIGHGIMLISIYALCLSWNYVHLFAKHPIFQDLCSFATGEFENSGKFVLLSYRSWSRKIWEKEVAITSQLGEEAFMRFGFLKIGKVSKEKNDVQKGVWLALIIFQFSSICIVIILFSWAEAL